MGVDRVKRTTKQLKPKTIRLVGDTQAINANALVEIYTADEEVWVCEFKKDKESKTLQQLRALFGTWYDYLSDTLGETKNDLHHEHKQDFLRLIYIENPQGDFQTMWVELLDKYIKDNDGVNFCKHRKRLSLSWATIDQMREYMTRIEHYYINAGCPLPILEKFERVYR